MKTIDSKYSMGIGKKLIEILINQPMVLKLYQNNVTLSPRTTVKSFKEADFIGYKPVDLEPKKWKIKKRSHYYEVVYPGVYFMSTSLQKPQKIYGFYVVKKDTGELIWADKFSDKPPMQYNFEDDPPNCIKYDGDIIKVVPIIRFE